MLLSEGPLSVQEKNFSFWTGYEFRSLWNFSLVGNSFANTIKNFFFFYLLGASNYFNGIFCSYCFLLLWSDGSELFSIKKILKVEGLKLQAAILKYMWRYLCL